MITAAPEALPRKRSAKRKLDTSIPAAVADRASVQAPPAAEPGRSITVIELAKLERHPKNRTIDPAGPDIKELAQSIAEHGQLDPMRVRPLSGGKYQIISGERRYHALVLAGSYGARCEVVHCDEATALAEVAVANAHRRDLDPIERAEMMQQLMKPTSEGGSGYTLLQAGAIYGLTSESGAKNALRLLKLPVKLRQMITAGEIPERAARRLVPYAHVSALISDVTNTFAKEDEEYRGQMIAELSREQRMPHWLRMMIDDHLRPISADVKMRFPYPVGEQSCLFDWKSQADQLNITEIPYPIKHDYKKHRDVIETRQFATNVKLWDKLQTPALKAAEEKAKSKQQSKSKSAKSSGKPLTPGQEKAAAQLRANKANDQLERFTEDWLARLLRCSIAQKCHLDNLVALTIPWITSICPDSDLRQYHKAAMVECQVSIGKSTDRWYRFDALPSLVPFGGSKLRDDTQKPFDIMNAFWRLILWPVTELIGDTAKRSEMTPAGQLPAKIVNISLDSCVRLAAIADVSIEAAWRAGTVDSSDARRLISVWLCRHTKDQLHALRNELHVTEGSSTMGRNELAECVLRAHRPGKPLAVPKRLVKVAK